MIRAMARITSNSCREGALQPRSRGCLYTGRENHRHTVGLVIVRGVKIGVALAWPFIYVGFVWANGILVFISLVLTNLLKPPAAAT